MNMLRTSQASDIRCAHWLPSYVPDTDTFLVHDGDLKIDGTLSLDWDAGWSSCAIIDLLATGKNATATSLLELSTATNLSGLVVTGNLHISGALVNQDGESGATLIVEGSLKARQASCGGAYVRVGGDVHIEDVLYAHYNDGWLDIGGALFAKALINDEHCVSINGNSACQPKASLTVINLRDIHHADDEGQVPTALTHKSVI